MSQTESTINPQKLEELKHAVQQLFDTGPDWATFFREVLGSQGLVKRAFPAPEQAAEFQHSEAYREIQQKLTALRKSPVPPNEEEEPTRVITIRLPKSLHEALRGEAYTHKTSVNKLCISKLLQYIDHELVPAE